MSAELIVPATVRPQPPTDLRVTGSNSGSVSLEWKAPTEVGGTLLTGYYAYYQQIATPLAAPTDWLKSSLL